MPGYVGTFDSGVVQPSDVSYRAVALTVAVQSVAAWIQDDAG